ncbi:hypothetical protein C8J56DRAFT_1109509 [Mycena floridula]|nr:hypothetical protein C8J56DRAFT_1109509 [Mycena floridula]
MTRKSINSPLAIRLLVTNEPPSTVEEAQLKDIFEEIDEDIHKVRQEILRLKASLKAAYEEHAQLLAARAAHRTIMSPVRRLPSDVILEILQWCRTKAFSPSNECVSFVTLYQDEGPWPLMSICRHWRTVITSHPTFWSNIYLSRRNNPSSFSDCLQFILDHSKDAPLTLRVVTVPPNLEKEAIRLLIPHSHRWPGPGQSDNQGQVIPFLSTFCDEGLPKGSVPQLRRLFLGSSVDIPLTCFEAAPRLETLDIGSVRLLHLPWNQIQQFSLDGGYLVQDIVSVLQMIPNVIDCSFNLRHDEKPSMTVRLPHLRRLKAKIIWRSTMCIEFLTGLEVPMLEEMNIGSSQGEINAAVTFIGRNACPIRTLRIANFRPPIKVRSRRTDFKLDLTTLSKSVSRLTKLIILGAGFQFIEFLRNPAIFLKLDHLSILTQDRYTEPMEGKHFSTVIEIIRTRPLLRLGTLHLSVAHIASRKAKQWFERDLQVFQNEGLDASLDFGDQKLIRNPGITT